MIGRLRGAALAMLLAGQVWPAAAQTGATTVIPDNGSGDNGVIAVPPAPPIVAAPETPATPSQTPAPAPAPLTPPGATGNSGDATPGSGVANPAPSPPDQNVIPTPPNSWQPSQTALLGVLDKVGGGIQQISIAVGGQSVIGDLQVSVQACMTRPSGQIPDAAVFLTLQPNTDGSAPSFRGWLVRSQPGASIAGDASETFRVIGCS